MKRCVVCTPMQTLLVHSRVHKSSDSERLLRDETKNGKMGVTCSIHSEMRESTSA
jgi:hypothetical protein